MESQTSGDSVSSALGPMSVEAEEALLGAILTLAELPELDLEAVQFGIERFGWAFEVILELKAEGKPVETVSVAERLERKGRLVEFGGHGALIQLIARCPSAWFLEHWAEIIKEKYRQRQLILVAGEVARLAYEGGPDLEARIRELIPQPRPEPEGQGLRGVISEIFEDLEHREISGYKFGLASLDEILVAPLSESIFYILSGESGVGKTALSLNVAANVAFQGGRVLFETLEMNPRRCLRRVISAYTGIPLTRLIRHELEDREVDLFSSFLGALEQASLEFRSDRTVGRISSAIARMNPDVVMVDYLQLLRSPMRDRVQAMEDISQQLKSLAERRAIWAVSSLSRGEGNLKWSGDLDYDADVILRLREGSGYLMSLEVQKQRDGPRGEVALAFLRPLQRFVELRSGVPAPMVEPETVRTPALF